MGELPEAFGDGQARGIANNESGWKPHVGNLMGDAIARDSFEEHFHGSMTDLVGGLNYRGDARLKEVFCDEFIEGNEGNAFGSGEAERVEALERAHAGDSVGGEK